MNLFVLRYLKTLAVVASLMGVYCLVVVPLVEPPQHGQQASPTFRPAVRTDHWWQAFFSEDAWQRQQPKIINTHQGVLVSKSWERIDEKTWKLQPLTMILPRSKSGASLAAGPAQQAAHEDMWIISAAEGATIHFEQPLDITTGDVPTVARGDLSGQIEVTKKTTSEADQLPWRLLTSDLSIDRRQISTQREVLIQWGSSVVRGRSLRILLRGDLLHSPTAQQSAWGPLDQLELFHVDEIDIHLPPGGLWADIEVGRLATEPELKQLPARLTATSGGRFSFDFKASVATLQNGVRLEHQLGDLPPDTFACDFVSLVVDPPSKDAPQSESRLGGLQFKSFEATGVDSVGEFVGEKWVEIHAPTMDMVARSKSLKVDLKKRRVSFAGRLNRPGATQSAVLLQYQGNEFVSPRIEYQAPPQSSDGAQPDHLGWMFAEGPGEIRTQGSASLGPSVVRWQQTLKMTPAAEGIPGQWIELLGKPAIESPEHGFLASDRLEVWLQRHPRPETDLPAAAATASTSLAADRFLPTRLYASGETVLQSPNLRAEVRQLDLKMKYESAVESPAAESGLALSDSSGHPMYQFVSPPGQPGATTAAEAAVASSPEASPSAPQPVPPQPVSVAGQQLVATIVNAGSNNWIEQLVISEQIKLWREEVESSLPWHIEGQQLVLGTNPAGEVDLQIEGAPAKVVLADGYLQGPAIRFNQTHNLVLMEHPGELIVPVQALRSRPSSDAATGIQWIEAPVCRWQGRMIFDGSRATLERDVEFKGALRTPQDQFWWMNGICQTLQVQLAEPLQLDSPTPQNPTVDQLVLSDNVQILASEIIGHGVRRGEKKSRHQINVPSLTFYAAREEFVGRGPGWIKSWFLADGQIGQLAGAVTSSSAEASASLQGAHLAFRDSMLGQLNKRALTFSGKVEVLTGPLPSWEQSVDLSQTRKLKLDQILLGGDQLKIYDTRLPNAYRARSPNQTWEFQALGNVAFNGKVASGEYVGTGHQLSYTKAKERLHLRGDGRNAAFLKRIPTDPQKNIVKGFVDSVDINPQTMDLHNLEVGQGGFQVESPDAYSDQGFVPAGQAAPGNSPPGSQPFEALPSARPDFYKR